MSEFDIPGTEPIPTETTETATTEKPKRRRGRPPKKVGPQGKEFAADLDKYGSSIAREVYYWVGTLPSSPVEVVTCAGINFPRQSATWVDDPMGGHEKVMKPSTGKLRRMTQKNVDQLRERLPMLVMRFTETRASEVDPGENVRGSDGNPASKNVGDPMVRKQKGRIVKIPSPQFVEAMKSQGRPSRLYVRDPSDEPAAKHLFAVPCEDQSNPTPGAVFPKSIYEAGLQWPE